VKPGITRPRHAETYYAATAIGLEDHPALAGEVRCDVCVVGGGFTGLSAALHLAERGYDVVLLEAERLGWGASGRNGGQLGTGQRKSQSALEAMLGEGDARLLWDLAEEAKATVKERIARHQIDCDLKPGVLTAAYKADDVAYLEQEVEHLERHYGYPHLSLVSRAETADWIGSDRYHGGLLDGDAGHLHPLNYALGLAKAATAAGARLFEASRVTAFELGRPNRLQTAGGQVLSQSVVLACNGYLGKLEPRLAAKIMPINNFVLATEPLAENGAARLIRDEVAVCDTKFVVD
jgi:gamma-glutamylputrescine oxidase